MITSTLNSPLNCKTSTKIIALGIEYFMRDLIYGINIHT